MGFRPRWWPLAIVPPASTVPGGERDSLYRCEESLVPPNVEALARIINKDRDDSCVARVPLDRFDRDWVGLPFKPSESFAVAQCVFAHEDAH